MFTKYKPHCIECGTDEAGRGCLAGPVTAAAVILPNGFKSEIINDSKTLSFKTRENLRMVIEDHALSYGIAHVFPKKIDEINILNASIEAMHLAIDQLHCTPEHILVDGNRFKPYKSVSHDCMVKGDSRFLSIAAASIMAKTERDRYMMQLAIEHPEYGWTTNRGYPTKLHREAIQKYGPSPYHRKSFRLFPEQYSLNF